MACSLGSCGVQACLGCKFKDCRQKAINEGYFGFSYSFDVGSQENNCNLCIASEYSKIGPDEYWKSYITTGNLLQYI